MPQACQHTRSFWPQKYALTFGNLWVVRQWDSIISVGTFQLNCCKSWTCTCTSLPCFVSPAPEMDITTSLLKQEEETVDFPFSTWCSSQCLSGTAGTCGGTQDKLPHPTTKKSFRALQLSWHGRHRPVCSSYFCLSFYLRPLWKPEQGTPSHQKEISDLISVWPLSQDSQKSNRIFHGKLHQNILQMETPSGRQLCLGVSLFVPEFHPLILSQSISVSQRPVRQFVSLLQYPDLLKMDVSDKCWWRQRQVGHWLLIGHSCWSSILNLDNIIYFNGKQTKNKNKALHFATKAVLLVQNVLWEHISLTAPP